MNQKGFINIIFIVIVVVLVVVGVYFVLNRQSSSSSPDITNFEECARAGYRVGESYPRQCWTPDDKHFVEEITKSPPPVQGPITVLGEITCLPKTGTGPQTLECAIGLKGLDGRYYGLKNLFQNDPDYTFSESGLHVEVSGIFDPEEMKGPDGNKYDVVGTINVTSIKKIAVSPTPSPLPKPDGERVSLREGQRKDSFLLEKIYSNRVTGLNFMEYPVARDEGFPVTLHIGEIVSNGCTITLTLTHIEGNTAIFTRKTDFNRPCPICLAGSTLIATPSGLVSVKDLKIGMLIWTTDTSGNRVSGVVQKTSKVPVPPTHQMVHIVLDDGRELFASPGHPIIDGRTIGDLVLGELYDGASVVSAERVPYGESATYDILPSGETGFYWADGVLLGSTLSHQ